MTILINKRFVFRAVVCLHISTFLFSSLRSKLDSCPPPPRLLDQIRRFFANGIRGHLRMALVEQGHDARVRHAESGHAADAQLGVQHRHRVTGGSHLAGPAGVIACVCHQDVGISFGFWGIRWLGCCVWAWEGGEEGREGGRKEERKKERKGRILQVVAFSFTKGIHSSLLVYAWCVNFFGQLPSTTSFVPLPLTIISFAKAHASLRTNRSNSSLKYR